MRLVVKSFSELNCKELYALLQARAAVFIVEQNCAYQDLDDVDYESLHVFFEENGSVLAYLRAFYSDQARHTVQIGRVLTVRRGEGLGRKLMEAGLLAVMQRMGPERTVLNAQCYAVPFYEKFGFRVVSAEFLEDGIPHVRMEKTK